VHGTQLVVGDRLVGERVGGVRLPEQQVLGDGIQGEFAGDQVDGHPAPREGSGRAGAQPLDDVTLNLNSVVPVAL